jgi:hypothetical protein
MEQVDRTTPTETKALEAKKSRQQNDPRVWTGNPLNNARCALPTDHGGGQSASNELRGYRPSRSLWYRFPPLLLLLLLLLLLGIAPRACTILGSKLLLLLLLLLFLRAALNLGLPQSVLASHQLESVIAVTNRDPISRSEAAHGSK